MMSFDAEGPVADGLLEITRRAAAAPQLRAAVVEAAGDDVPDPLPGDLWRATWDDVSILIVAVRVTGVEVLGVPVTIDPAVGDDATVCLNGDQTVLGVGCAAWVGLSRVLPWRVLDLRLGPVAAEAMTAISAIVADRGAVDRYVGLVGAPVESVFDPVARERAELTDALDQLVATEWAPVASGRPVTPRDLLGADIDLELLSQVLGEPAPRTWKIFNGQAPLSVEQAERVTQQFGVDANRLLAGVAPPHELMTELEHPRWRRRLHAMQRRQHLDDAAARLAAAQGAFALAARKTGSTAAPAWGERLARHFDTTLR